MEINGIPMIGKQRFTDFKWSYGTLFYSDGSNTVIAESDTTKKDIKEDFSVFDIDREIICFVDNKNPNIHLMNWKNGEKISDLYPINPSIELRLDFDKDHLFSLEEQIDGQRYHIYNIKTQKHELLCEQFEFHRFLDISKNSEFLCFIAWKADVCSSFQNSLMVYKNTDSGFNRLDIDHDFEHFSEPKFSEKSGNIIVLARKKDEQYHAIYSYDLDLEKWTLIYRPDAPTTRPLETTSSSLFTANSQYCFFVSHDHGFSRLKAFDLNSGTIKELEKLKKYTYIEDIRIDDNLNLIAFIASSYKNTPTLVVYDIAKDSIKEVKTTFPSQKIAHNLSSPELMQWKSSSYETSWGLLYCCPNTVKAPLVIMVHNGPMTQAYAGWPSKAHYLNSLGYHALYVNYRGSSGYGLSYLKSAKGSSGEKEAKDIFFAVEHLRKMQRIDNYKLAIWGGGAGAFIVLKTLEMFPHLFRLGITVYPYINLNSVIKKAHF